MRFRRAEACPRPHHHHGTKCRSGCNHMAGQASSSCDTALDLRQLNHLHCCRRIIPTASALRTRNWGISRLGLAVFRSRARGGKCGRNGAHFQSRQCRKTCQRRETGVGRRLLEGNYGTARLLAHCPLSTIARLTNSRTAGVPLSVFGRCCLSFGGWLDCIRVDDNHNNSEFCCLDRADLLLKPKNQFKSMKALASWVSLNRDRLTLIP